MTAAKWALFRLAERLSGAKAGPPPQPETQASRVVYASTLGELNAVSPFLDALERIDPAPVWLLSEHPHYEAAYRARYPRAHFYAINAASQTARQFFERVKPKTFLLAEIPLLPHDAPARLPFGWVRYARAAGAKVALINGWCYGGQPACRIDALERRWFSREQLSMFDLITVQRDSVREALIASGAPAERVHVTGSLKFDATGAKTSVPQLMPGRLVINAGSMNNAPEYRLVLEAFCLIKKQLPQSVLLIAPRHPENTARTDLLAQQLAQRGLEYRLRSACRDIPPEIDCLVLDTLGELAGSYAHCRLAHVGINHNVLEPLLLGRPVTVAPGWEPRYPSYPVYLALREAGLITEARDPATLAHHWSRLIATPPTGLAQELAAMRGATSRTLALWRGLGG